LQDELCIVCHKGLLHHDIDEECLTKNPTHYQCYFHRFHVEGTEVDWHALCYSCHQAKEAKGGVAEEEEAEHKEAEEEGAREEAEEEAEEEETEEEESEHKEAEHKEAEEEAEEEEAEHKEAEHKEAEEEAEVKAATGSVTDADDMLSSLHSDDSPHHANLKTVVTQDKLDKMLQEIRDLWDNKHALAKREFPGQAEQVKAIESEIAAKEKTYQDTEYRFEMQKKFGI
jgi:hypothetical protein